ARTEAVDPAFLELRKKTVSGQVSVAPSKRIEGSTNWTGYEVNIDIGPAGADLILALDLLINNKQGSNAAIWLKDIEVVNLSPTKNLREVVPFEPKGDPTATETLLKRFDPKVDKLLQTKNGDLLVTVDSDCWRIEAKKAPASGSAFVRLFELPQQ